MDLDLLDLYGRASEWTSTKVAGAAWSTGQETTMPEGLPQAAYTLIYGRFTDDQRKGVFKPEIPVAPDASAQDKLLAYTGRDPSPTM